MQSYPEVRPSQTTGGGLGLFAERDYFAGELVTQYGGRRSDTQIDGDYVLMIKQNRKKPFYLDTQEPGSFKEPEQRGRYINESISRRNVDARFNSRTQQVEFYVRSNTVVPKGTEFFWYYGDEYKRNYDPK